MAKMMELKDLVSFIPLFLEEDALALYLEMKESDRLNDIEIECILKEAFAHSMFDVNGRLKSAQWWSEQADVFASEIKRLAGLVEWSQEWFGESYKLAFVSGFLCTVSPSHLQFVHPQFCKFVG